MNKIQINYAKERINVIKNQLRDLFKFFDFSGDIEFATANELYQRKIKYIKEEITEAANQYLDQIVLDGKTDSVALAAFKKRKFI